MRLAIFDLDGTVLSRNSWQEFFRWRLCRSGLHAPGLLGAAVARKAGMTSSLQLRQSALRTLRGLSREEVRRIGGDVFNDRLRRFIRPSAREEIRAAREAGCRAVLATAAFDFLAQPVADELQVEYLICSPVAFDGQLCRGALAGPETRGLEKARAVQRCFAQHEIDWRCSRAYSDEIEDAPLWRLVGDPVLVTRPGGKPPAAPRGVRVVQWAGA